VPTSQNAHTYTLDELRSKPESGWDGDINGEDKSSVGAESKRGLPNQDDGTGVKVTIDREVMLMEDKNYGRK
jgi:hypothetical protein